VENIFYLSNLYPMKNKKFIYFAVALLFVVIAGSVYLSSAGGQDLLGRFGGGARGQADLVVQEISVDSDNKLSIQVGNEGSRNVRSSAAGHTYIYLEDMSDPAWTYAWSTLTDQNFRTAGSSSTLQPQKINDVYTVQACVDAKEVVSESDETNNCLTEIVEPEDTEEAGAVTRGSFVYQVLVDMDPSNALLVCEDGGSPFTDVDSSDPYCGAINYAANEGLIFGDPDGTFEPDDTLSRAGGAKWAYTFYGVTTYTPGSPSFDDVDSSDWFYEYVESLNAAGALEFSSGNFHPNETLYQNTLDYWMSVLG
jgi:hypothetical protein